MPPEGYYLSGRPQFTFDPLFHAGCYYVQEASSMFITHVIKSWSEECGAVLDLCAAPGGKSTAMRTVLPEGSILVSNEPIANRAQILLENITKWGWPNCIVTNNSSATYPAQVKACSGRILPPLASGVCRTWRSVGVCNGKLSPTLGSV